jgi:hypothetical protein
MTALVSRLLVGTDADQGLVSDDASWLQWLSAHTDRVAAGRMGRVAVAVHRRFGQRSDRCVAVSYSGLSYGGTGL